MPSSNKPEFSKISRRRILSFSGLTSVIALTGCVGVDTVEENDDPDDDEVANDDVDDQPEDDENDGDDDEDEVNDENDDDEVDDDDVDDEDDLREIKLGGQVERWVGEYPEEIEGEGNPTLELEEGKEYSLTWENLDGVGHNFMIEDEDGDIVVETEIMMEEGGTQTVEFTAAAGMSEYFCQPHPLSMRGDIEIFDNNQG